jgi:Zn-dependent alcohol dehydrogenase
LKVPVAPHIDREVTSIIGCAVMTGAGAVIHSAGVQTGDSMAVFGAGGVGLAAIAAARLLGVAPLIAVDVDAGELDPATHFGATDIVNADRCDAVEVMRELVCNLDHLDALGEQVSGVDKPLNCK